jgi:Zn-dependent oligopeptidase
MRLDLCDRPGKYSNGFCHWEVPAWQSPEGWVPSQTNFTSLADPKAIGSGLTALTTLMHEAGHAAHFANVVQQSPLFSQERAPTSVAYAENQSMFLDSLVDDAAWAARYALSTAGEPIPWSILEAGMRATHEYKVFALRMMLAVPFFEKALYELPADQLTPQRILSLADEVEQYIQGGFSSRPLMTVPHILSGESSAYYHGYVLAEMSVHQTREHFLRKYGSIVDNPRVGEDLKNVYWAPGNSEAFRDLVQRLTGHPLSADAWVADLQTDLEKAIVDERAAYEEARAMGPKFPSGTNVDLDMRVLLVHGDEVIADSGEHNLVSACAKYRQWLEAR